MDPWERQPGETKKAYEAFCLYRDYGPDRSIRKIQPGDNKASMVGHYSRWSRLNDWVARVEAYDAYLEREARKKREAEHLEEIEKYRSTMSNVSQATLKAATDMLHIIIRTVEAQRASGDSLESKEVPVWLRGANDSIEKAMTAWAQSLGLEEIKDILSDLDNDGD